MKWLEMLHSGSLEYGKSVQNFFSMKLNCHISMALNQLSDNVRPHGPTPSDLDLWGCYLRADYSFSSDDETWNIDYRASNEATPNWIMV